MAERDIAKIFQDFFQETYVDLNNHCTRQPSVANAELRLCPNHSSSRMAQTPLPSIRESSLSEQL